MADKKNFSTQIAELTARIEQLEECHEGSDANELGEPSVPI